MSASDEYKPYRCTGCDRRFATYGGQGGLLDHHQNCRRFIAQKNDQREGSDRTSQGRSERFETTFKKDRR